MSSIIARRRTILPYVFISLLYIGMSVWVRCYRMGSDWQFFIDTFRIYFEGEPFSLYSIRAVDVVHEVGGHGIAYGPLFQWAMLPGFMICYLFRLPGVWVSILPWLGFLVFDLLLASEIFRHVREPGKTDDKKALFCIVLFLSSWMLLFSSPYHGHFETMPVFFLLVGLRLQKKERDVWAGVLFGLALLSKHTVVVALIAHWSVLAFNAKLRRLLNTVVTAALVFLGVMLPYIISDPQGVFEMFIKLQKTRLIAYQSVWHILPEGSGLRAVVSSFVEPVSLLAIITFSCIFALQKRIAIGSDSNYGLMALAAVIVACTQKWGSLHYYLLAFVLMLVWEARKFRFPWAAALFASVLSNIFVLWVSRETQMPFSPASSCIMLFLFVGTIIYIGTSLGSRVGKQARVDSSEKS